VDHAALWLLPFQPAPAQPWITCDNDDHARSPRLHPPHPPGPSSSRLVPISSRPGPTWEPQPIPSCLNAMQRSFAFSTCPACPGVAVGRSRGSRAITRSMLSFLSFVVKRFCLCSSKRRRYPHPSPVNPEKYRLMRFNPGVDFSRFGSRVEAGKLPNLPVG